MTKTCPRCRGPLRRDESLATIHAADGTWSACPCCVAGVNGTDPPEPKVYPVGIRMPVEPGTTDAPLTVCGICRHALYWTDRVRAVRLQPEDLVDDAWREYTALTAGAAAQHRAAVRDVRDRLQDQTRGHDETRDKELARLDRELQEASLYALANCQSQEDYVRREMPLTRDHQQAAELVRLAHEAATGPHKALADAATRAADFAYRQAAVRAFLELRHRFAEPGSLSPGCYHSCRDCLAAYRPRVRERLIRAGLVAASLDEDQIEGNLLL